MSKKGWYEANPLHMESIAIKYNHVHKLFWGYGLFDHYFLDIGHGFDMVDIV